MGLIKQHLKKESLKTYKDAYLLVKLSKVNDKGTITYEIGRAHV